MPTIMVSGVICADFKISIHLFRQILAAIATGLLGFAGGITVGYCSVLLPQLKEDSTYLYDAIYDSWIASITPLSMALGATCAGPVIDKYGRKFGLIGLVPLFLLGWLVLALATNIEYMLAGRFITGVAAGAYRPMSVVFLGEVTDPKHRAMTLISISLLANVGVLGSHVTGAYFYWRTSALIFCVPVVLSLLLLVLLEESPLWLISNGKIYRGTEVFHWYRVRSAAADEELEKVINRQGNGEKRNLKETLNVIFSKPFMKAFSVCVVLFVAVQFCGVNTINFYAIDILKNTFSGQIDVFTILFVIDVIRVFGALFVFVCVKYVPRRPLYLFCSFGTTIVLLGLALYLFLNSLAYVWIGITSMIAFIALSNTMVSISWSFLGEIYPNKVRGLGSAMTSLLSFMFLFIVVKITPAVMEMFGVAIMYTGSAVIVLICSVILCLILPETNGKSLQEIEDNLNKSSIDNKNDVQAKV